MKIVTWNCNGALRNKTVDLDALNGDIYVIQECENPSTSSDSFKSWAGNYLWHGTNKNKGIGIFAKNGIELTKLEWTGEFEFKIDNVIHRPLKWNSESLELFLPCLINKKIPLLAVWTKSANSKNFGYVGQFWIYLQIHQEQLKNPNQIICGDFNSNTIWDEADRLWNHSDVIDQLKQLEIHSLYHQTHNEIHGKETQSTFFLHRRLARPYHIDYFFAHKILLQNSIFKLHSDNHWLTLSDHLPIEATIMMDNP